MKKIYEWPSQKKALLNFVNSKNFLKYGYPETLESAKPIFRNHVDELIELGPLASNKQKLKTFHKLTFELFQMNELVETVERETFYIDTWEIANIVGIGSTPKQELEFERNLHRWRYQPVAAD